MKWYHIKFSEAELSALTDEKLIKDFIRLVHQLKQPKGLIIYELKSGNDYGKELYISCPEENAYELKKILAYYSTNEVSRPSHLDLNSIIGKKGS